VRPENHDMTDETAGEVPVANVANVAHPVAKPVARPMRRRPNTARITRLTLLVIGALLAGVFTVAFWLNPYDADGRPRTMATHTQLGMPPCNFVILTGKPCPSCGMTTSFALLVRGDISASLRANWAGTLVAVLWAATMVWAIASGIRGKPLFIPPGRGELYLTVSVGAVLLLMLVRWVAVLI
jgi:uncharacterized protein DUF2752